MSTIKRFIARQLARPSGLFGRVVMGRWLNRMNNVHNALVLREMELAPTDRVLELGFGGGQLLERILEKSMVRHCLVLIFLGFLLCPNLSAKEARTTVGVNFPCSLYQGFNFNTGNQDVVGHLVSITIADRVIPANFTVKNPLNSSTTRSVVGVISEISWGGGATDPISINAQVSTEAKNVLLPMLHSTLPSTMVDFQFVVYEHDPAYHKYFQAFHSNTVTLRGLIWKTGGDLAISLSSDAGGEVSSPTNYPFTITIMPQAIEQTMYHALAVDMETEKQWGIRESTPVELIDFTAQPLAGGAVALSWKTATEVDAYGFDVERKEAGTSVWTKFGFVPANGTSNVPHEYSYCDAPQASGAYCYRLKSIDRDGGFEYSKTVEAVVAEHPQEFALHQNYPNPFNPSTVIEYELPLSAIVSITVYDQMGREVRTLVDEVKPPGFHHVQWDGRDHRGRMASSGIYLCRLRAGGHVQTRQMILMK